MKCLQCSVEIPPGAGFKPLLFIFILLFALPAFPVRANETSIEVLDARGIPVSAIVDGNGVRLQAEPGC
jgi:hypothetical protein